MTIPLEAEALYEHLADFFGSPPRWRPGKKQMQLNCPFCKETDHKLWINAYNHFDPSGKLIKKAGRWICWKGRTAKCQKGGSLWDLTGWRESANPDYALRHLERIPSEETQARTHGWINPGRTIPLHELVKSHPARQYWNQRNYDPDELGRKYQVLWCAECGGRHRTPEGRHSFDREGWLSTTNHFIFPIIMHGIRIGWQARSLGDPKPLRWQPTPGDDGYWQELPEDYPPIQETTTTINGIARKELVGRPGDKIKQPPKYFHFFEKGRSLGNFDAAKNNHTVIVTEGWTKAFRVGPAAIVTFGKIITDYQIRLIANYWNEAVLLLDRDAHDLYEDRFNPATGQSEPGYLARFNEYVNTRAVRLPQYDDPGDAPTEFIWNAIHQAAQNDPCYIELERNKGN